MCTASWNEYALRDRLGNTKEFNSDFGLDWRCPERSCPLHHVMRKIFSHTLTGVGILLIVFVLLGCRERVSYTPSEEIGVKSDSLEKSGLSLDKLERVDSVDCQPCDINSLADFEKKIDTCSKRDAVAFFCLFDRDCANSVEFSEFSNELLFVFLQKKPQLFVEALNDLSSQDKLYVILEELESPIHDGFDIDAIINSLEQVVVAPPLNDLKGKIVKALKIALSKSR